MVAEAAERLQHLKENIANIRRLLYGRSIDQLRSDVFAKAALERFLEVISEASRHVPNDWKDSHGTAIPWRKIADFGNVLRHGYEEVDLAVLWSVYENDLDPQERAVDAMLAAHSSKDGSS
jgi:uncharacterized protein with HEPN domain